MIASGGATDRHDVGKATARLKTLHGQRLHSPEHASDPYAKLWGSLHEIDMLVAGRTADLLHVFPDKTAMVHLQTGHFGHVQPVGYRPGHVDPVDARDGRDRSQSFGYLRPAGLRVANLVEVTDPRDQARVVLAARGTRPRRRRKGRRRPSHRPRPWPKSPGGPTCFRRRRHGPCCRP